MRAALTQPNHSVRSYRYILKPARTIADLAVLKFNLANGFSPKTEILGCNLIVPTDLYFALIVFNSSLIILKRQ
jgi:hypothetical protein